MRFASKRISLEMSKLSQSLWYPNALGLFGLDTLAGRKFVPEQGRGEEEVGFNSFAAELIDPFDATSTRFARRKGPVPFSVTSIYRIY